MHAIRAHFGIHVGILSALLGLSQAGSVVAQGNGNSGGFNSGFPTTTQFPTTGQFPTTSQFPTTQQSTGNNTGSGDTAAQQPNIADSADLDIGFADFEFEAIENAFVGSTAATIGEGGFVGSTQQDMTGQAGGTGGGGTTGGNTGLRNSGAAQRQNAGLGGFGASQFVQQIPRGGVRARLVNGMGSIRPEGQFVRERVESRLMRTPVMQNTSLAGISISIDNGTATLTGVASSRDAADRLVRQLRLEPGVYRVDNRLTTAQQ